MSVCSTILVIDRQTDRWKERVSIAISLSWCRRCQYAKHCIFCTHCVSNKTTLMLYTITYPHHPILAIFGRHLLREYAIKLWFDIPPLLTNVYALLGETCTPEIDCLVMLDTVSRQRRCFSLLYLPHLSANSSVHQSTIHQVYFRQSAHS